MLTGVVSIVHGLKILLSNTLLAIVVEVGKIHHPKILPLPVLEMMLLAVLPHLPDVPVGILHNSWVVAI